MPIIRYSSTNLSRHPLQVFILVLCLISSIPTLFGALPAPSSLEALEPLVLVRAWAGLLFFGSVLAFLGIYWRNRVTGIIIEQVGFIWLALAAFTYASALIIVVGFRQGAAIPIGIILSFAISAAWRAVQLQNDIRALKYEKQKAERLEGV